MAAKERKERKRKTGHDMKSGSTFAFFAYFCGQLIPDCGCLMGMAFIEAVIDGLKRLSQILQCRDQRSLAAAPKYLFVSE